MTKHNGKYYLQYASPATQFNTYCDGVYVADAPLGPFTLQQSNPFSSKPGGFMQGAGHGSTIQDADGNFWHASTMRVSVNHDMERRVGLFPAGVDADGVLFCNQNFADYPLCIPDGKFDPWSVRPACMLLSYQKPTAPPQRQRQRPGAGRGRKLPHMVERSRRSARPVAFGGFGEGLRHPRHTGEFCG